MIRQVFLIIWFSSYKNLHNIEKNIGTDNLPTPYQTKIFLTSGAQEDESHCHNTTAPALVAAAVSI